MSDPTGIDPTENAKQLAEELAVVLRKIRTAGGGSEAIIDKHLASMDDKLELSDKLKEISFAYGPDTMDAIPSWMVRCSVRTDDNGIGKLQTNNALALLLINGVIFTSTHWWQDSWPEDAKKTTCLAVNTNDVFAWGVADAEEISIKEIGELFTMWEKDPYRGSTIWAIIKTKEMPQRPVEEQIRKAGIWDLDALQKEHGLLPNFYDGTCHVLAQYKYEMYSAWGQSQGQDPLPFDKHWWDGWRDYAAAHPNWYDDAWKAEEQKRLNQWKQENGYTPKEIVNAQK